MDLVQWVYAHPELAVGAGASGIACVRWALGLSQKLDRIGDALVALKETLDSHDKRIDDHESRLRALEIGEKNGLPESVVG